MTTLIVGLVFSAFGGNGFGHKSRTSQAVVAEKRRNPKHLRVTGASMVAKRLLLAAFGALSIMGPGQAYAG